MLKKRYAFVALFTYEDNGISIEFPDLPGCYPCAEGNDTELAIKNVKEALGLHLYGMEEDEEEIPSPTSIRDIKLSEGQIPVLIDVFMPPIREQIKTQFVKKTLSLPAWLSAAAEADGVNCSKLFQNALIDYLGIQK